MQTEPFTARQGYDPGRRLFHPPRAVAAILGLFAILFAAAPVRGKEFPRSLRIEYGDLVDRSAMTHSGNTVGAMLKKASRGGARPSKEVLSNLEPFLEPFSFVLNDIVAAARPAQGGAFANIADAYPAGSRQPGWAALFREGRFRLFSGDGRARLFLEGRDPGALLRKYHGVVRHPLRDLLEKSGRTAIALEVYAFRNDYRTMTLTVDPSPYATVITAGDCTPRARELPLPGLADFFAGGPSLEAVEIDRNGDFFLYAGGVKGETIAGRPVSLADFAVVYRAVFHHGHSPPFISLDPAEDNRYAKVNFGGHLADTRVGSVLLEADKLFKTMISGLDPDTRTSVAEKIRTAVPDFRTADERVLFRDEPGTARVRFWFYPDRIRTVTDGRIGAVESYRFLADEERMDNKAGKYRPGRETVDHLNRNFGRYARALSPYAELQTVGRMMAVATWLHRMDPRRRVDLDAFLSVEIPPHKTPRRTLKMLTVTEGVRVPRADSFDEYRKVYSLDNILVTSGPATDDARLLDEARARIFRMGGVETLPPGGARRCTAGVPRSFAASISGGVDLDPANCAPPRTAPGSPLIARVLRARSKAGQSRTDRGDGMIRSAPARSSTPRPKPEIPPAPGSKERAVTPAVPAAAPRKAVSGTRSGGFVMTTSGYPAEIVVKGDPSGGGTIVLRRGKSVRGGDAPEFDP